MIWFLVAVIALLVWATLIERYLFTVKRATIKVLPKGSAAIRVLHVSDVHLAGWQKRKAQWLKHKLSELEPDLIVNTGDNLGHRSGVDLMLEVVEGLKVKGVFVNGSNDLYAPVVTNPFSYLLKPSQRHRDDNPENKLDTEKLNSGFEKLGWLNLNNASGSLEVNGVKINFIGTDDPHEGRADLNQVSAKAQKLTKADFRIGVTHAPYLNVLDHLASLDAKLIFAGHTHGGQVCWPIVGRALVTNCDLPTKYARGNHKLARNGKTFWLNVCAGLGHSIFAPIRFSCRPEVRLITLVAED